MGSNLESRTAADRAAYRKRWLASDAGRAYKAKERARYKSTPNGHAVKLKADRDYKVGLQDVRMAAHTFVGVDGEGWTDDAGQHHYMMLIAGRKHLHTGAPLKSFDCLMFLATLPSVKHQYYVSFFFDYDTTMILRDLAQVFPEEVKRLFAPSQPGEMVWFQFGRYSIGINYRPKKHLSVKLWSDDKSTKTVTIHDVQGFFQSSFVVALDKFEIGTPEERDFIRAMKAKRDSFTGDEANDILDYSKRECVLLSDLVSRLRDHSMSAKTNADPYEGPGSMAQRAIVRHYGKARHEETIERTPPLIMERAARAYYGGRFEVLAHGPIDGPVYEYDLKSAYPFAMADLPCFAHGHWSTRKPTPVGIAEITWSRDNWEYGDAMPYPMRARDGHIYYPVSGHGWYWLHELVDIGGETEIHNVRWWHQNCDHHPYRWIHSMYHEREHLEFQHKGSGIALKLMMNTLYGKTAQQRPVPGQFLNMLHASFVTSMTRTRCYREYLAAPQHSIIMFATDAIFSRVPLGIESVNPGLGDWELASKFDDLTIFQPGVYFDGDRAAFKTRGVPKQVFRDNASRLRAISTTWHEPCVCGVDDTVDYHCPQHFPVRLETHLGLRLALARGTNHSLSQIGNWVPITKRMTADPFKKRTREVMDIGNTLYSSPRVNMSGLTRRGHGSTYALSKGSVAEQVRLDDDLISDGYYEGDFADE